MYLAEGDTSTLFVLYGYVGTGKTTLVAAIVAALKNMGIRSILLAPTGRAAHCDIILRPIREQPVHAAVGYVNYHLRKQL